MNHSGRHPSPIAFVGISLVAAAAVALPSVTEAGGEGQPFLRHSRNADNAVLLAVQVQCPEKTQLAETEEADTLRRMSATQLGWGVPV
jgi:hypothetical protein